MRPTQNERPRRTKRAEHEQEAGRLLVILLRDSRLHAGPALPPVPLTSTAPATHHRYSSGQPLRNRAGLQMIFRAPGFCCRRLLEWATYCPKRAHGCCHPECNLCHYKGTLPLYLLMLNPHCVEGSGIHPTVPPIPCTSHKGCASCRSCGGCANGTNGESCQRADCRRQITSGTPSPFTTDPAHGVCSFSRRGRRIVLSSDKDSRAAGRFSLAHPGDPL